MTCRGIREYANDLGFRQDAGIVESQKKRLADCERGGSGNICRFSHSGPILGSVRRAGTKCLAAGEIDPIMALFAVGKLTCVSARTSR